MRGYEVAEREYFARLEAEEHEEEVRQEGWEQGYFEAVDKLEHIFKMLKREHIALDEDSMREIINKLREWGE